MTNSFAIGSTYYDNLCSFPAAVSADAALQNRADLFLLPKRVDDNQRLKLLRQFDNFLILFVQKKNDRQFLQQGTYRQQVGQGLLIVNVKQDKRDIPPGLPEPGGKTVKRPVLFHPQLRTRFLQSCPDTGSALSREWQ